jgi:uncharacterized protein YecT (DUF1311 family)
VAQNDRPRPSFDCGVLFTRVQMSICNSLDLSELDRDLARYILAFKSVLSDEGARALEANQAAWERARDTQCNRVIGEIDPDGPVYRCLMTMYRTRLVQLAVQNDRLKGGSRGVSGHYRYIKSGVAGEMWIIGWPEAAVTVLIDTLTLPDIPTCALRMESEVDNRSITGFAQSAPECKVSVKIEGRGATVASSNCHAVCVLNGRIDGAYRR